MAENSKIEWTDHTFNPWIGCTKISPGCANCYAEQLMDVRLKKVKWGRYAPRVRTSQENWNMPLKWDRQAAKDGKRVRVFCASLADWLDDEVIPLLLMDLLDLIRRTPNLDWLLLTKRPENWRRLLENTYTAIVVPPEYKEWVSSWLNGNAPANVWVGATVEDQQRADERIPALQRIPAAVRFLSCEPLLGPVYLQSATWWTGGPFRPHQHFTNPIHWIIAGGESGPNARPMNPAWARFLRDQCAPGGDAYGTAFFFKQWGCWAPHGGKDGLVEVLYAGKGGHFENHRDHEGKWMPDQYEAGCQHMRLTTKEEAGHLLDGREHREFPR